MQQPDRSFLLHLNAIDQLWQLPDQLLAACAPKLLALYDDFVNQRVTKKQLGGAILALIELTVIPVLPTLATLGAGDRPLSLRFAEELVNRQQRMATLERSKGPLTRIGKLNNILTGLKNGIYYTLRQSYNSCTA